MKVPTTFTVDESKPKAVSDIKKEEPVKKVENVTLQDLLGKEICGIAEELEMSEPSQLRDAGFETVIKNYFLTKQGVEKIIALDYKHKNQEAWIDIYIIEYKEGKAAEDHKCLAIIPDIILRNQDRKSEIFRFLLKEDYTVLIHSYEKGMENSIKKVVDYYRTKFGMKEVEEVICKYK